MELSERPWEGLPGEIAVAIRERLPTMVDDALVTIPLQIAAYRAPDTDGVSVAEALDRVRVAAEHGLTRFADLIDRRAQRGADLDEVYRAIGRATFDRGFGLEVMTEVSRVFARIGLQWVGRIGDDLGLPMPVVLRAAEALYVYIDELSMLTAQGFREATATATAERHARRAQLLDVLLLASPAPDRTVRQVAERAGWSLPAAVAVVALGPDEPATAVAGTIAPDVLAGSSDGTPLLLVPDPDGPDRARRVAAALAGRAASIGPTVGPHDARRSLSWARRTLALAAADAGPLPRRADDHLADLLLSDDTPLLEALVERRLASLDQLADAVRDRLCDTLLAWLEHDRSAPAAARVLHTHPGTVRYRLAQLRELLGDALDRPDTRFELRLALRARRLADGHAGSAVPGPRRPGPDV